MPKNNLSPEATALIKQWCDMQKEKYGENWKEILAKEMAKETMKKLQPLFELQRK